MELDDLLDQLPHGLARKVAAALAPDTESDGGDLTGPRSLPDPPENLGPCPNSFDTDLWCAIIRGTGALPGQRRPAAGSTTAREEQ